MMKNESNLYILRKFFNDLTSMGVGRTSKVSQGLSKFNAGKDKVILA